MAGLPLGQVVIVIVAAIAAARVAGKFRVPELVPLLLAGYILGGDLLGFLRPEELGASVGSVALLAVPVILFNDGMRTDLRNLHESFKTVVSINTVAVLVTVVGMAFFASIVLHLSLISSILLGAILASTDPAGVIPVLRKLNISKRLSTILEAESAFNDASAIAVFTVALGLAVGNRVTLNEGVAQLVYLVGMSIIVAVAVGFALNEFFRQFKVQSDLVLSSFVVLMVSYAAAETIGASGVIAAVGSALIFRQYLQSPGVESVHRMRVLSVWSDLNFLAIAVIFLVLGSEVRLGALAPFVVLGFALALAFMLIVRPLTILVSMLVDNSFSLREKAVISWLGSPRGSVSAALASIILAKSHEGAFSAQEASVIFSITLVVIIATSVIAGLSASQVVRRLFGMGSETGLEGEYQVLAVELKTMMVASRKLREEWKQGMVSTKIYDAINAEHARHMKEIEDKLAAISAKAPAIEDKVRALRVREVILNQLSALEVSYDNKEIPQAAYAELLGKYEAQLNRLSEIEEMH